MYSVVAPVIAGLAVGIILIVVFAVFSSIPSTVTKTLTVKIDCLPIKTSVFGGINTEICNLGLFDKNGRHYGITPNEKSNRLLSIFADDSNKVFRVTGNVTSPPPDELKIYDVVGIIDVYSFAGIDDSKANNTTCGQTIEDVKASAPSTVLLPTNLPKGYSLQTVDYVPNVYVIMQYFTRSLCDPNNLYSPDEGVIEIVEGSLIQFSNAKTGEEYVQIEMAKYAAINFNATSYVFHDGKMHAVGYEAGIGTSKAIDENANVVHQTQFDYAAHLWAVDDNTGTIVKIEARSTDIALEQLAAIAESLEEY